MTHPNGQPSMKDKKTLNFLKAKIIIKMIDHSVSLVKKKKKITGYVLKFFSYPNTVFLFYATYLLSDGFFQFCNCLWIVLVKSPKDRI